MKSFLFWTPDGSLSNVRTSSFNRIKTFPKLNYKVSHRISAPHSINQILRTQNSSLNRRATRTRRERTLNTFSGCVLVSTDQAAESKGDIPDRMCRGACKSGTRRDRQVGKGSDGEEHSSDNGHRLGVLCRNGVEGLAGSKEPLWSISYGRWGC